VKKKLSAVSSRLSAGARPRILAGRWKGRRLNVPRGARPTSSRAREALFAILQDAIRGSRFLDLFAGSGAMGLEALSRGASSATFVENDSRALERNLAMVGAGPEESDVLRDDARAAVSSLAARGETFDLVFVDPPYSLEAALSKRAAALLAPAGTLVVQTDSDASAPGFLDLFLRERRHYGRNVFWFFGKAER
jgi:16S rRNA (guanine(966)-N(2))-methyltransferase RsmD